MEDEQAFKKHCDGIREALAAVGALELDLAQAIAEDRWRLNRARALENSIFALGQSEHLLQDSGHPEVDAALVQAEEEVAAFIQLAQTEGGDYDPADDFPPESQPPRFLRKYKSASAEPATYRSQS